MFPFLGFLFFLIVLVFVLLAINSRLQRVTYEDSFARGKVPDPFPDGPHKGNAHVIYGARVGWLGKKFVASSQSGVNMFSGTGQRLASVLTPKYKKFEKQPDGTFTAYEFRMSMGSGIKNPNQQVLKLDYNFEGNPGLIRIILDEVVQIDPGKLLGKIHLQVLPGWFLTLGYFALEPGLVSAPAAPSLTQAPSTPAGGAATSAGPVTAIPVPPPSVVPTAPPAPVVSAPATSSVPAAVPTSTGPETMPTTALPSGPPEAQGLPMGK